MMLARTSANNVHSVLTRLCTPRVWLASLCLLALILNASEGSAAQLAAVTALPCSQAPTGAAPDTHAFLPDENLEQLALRLSSGLYADRAVYTRLVRDITAIRTLDPTLTSVHYRPDRNIRVLRVTFEPVYFWRARMNLYSDWDCPNRFLGASMTVHSEFHYIELTFGGLYNPQITSQAYRELPGVTAAEFSGILGDGSNIYVSRSEGIWHYVLDLAGGDCPSGCTEHELHYFQTALDGNVQPAGTWMPREEGSSPEWVNTYFRTYR